MTMRDVLEHLRTHGLVVRERRRGAVAHCPAHADRKPSLDITTGRDGRTLLYCRAGCNVVDVLAALGLRFRDLFATSPAPRSRPRGAPKDWTREEAEAIARRQSWPRHLDRYAAADAIRAADRMRREARESDANVWEHLARLAALTTTAENVLAGEGEP
jgi:hypothetical protein